MGGQPLNFEWGRLGVNVLHPKWCGCWLNLHHPRPHDERKKANRFQAALCCAYLQIHWAFLSGCGGST